MPTMTSDAHVQRKAVIFGPADIRLEMGPVPTPKAGEALVAMRTVGICGSDVAYFRGTSKYEVLDPFVMGHEAAGIIIGMGEQLPASPTTTLAIGSRVAIHPGTSCGHCVECRAGADNLCAEIRYLGSASTRPPTDGALQAYMIAPLAQFLPIPDSVSFATAALLEPLAVAEHAVHKAEVAGKSVLICGGGTIGQLLAMVARSMGAANVTVCEIQARRRFLALEHGADQVGSPVEIEDLIAQGQHFDIALDATGNEAAVALCIHALKRGTGRFIIVGNLPPKSSLPPELIARAEIWLTATFRFPGGLARALALVTSGMNVEWLVEHTALLSQIDESLARAAGNDAPIKIQITSFDDGT